MRPEKSTITNALIILVLTLLVCALSCSDETSVGPVVAGDSLAAIDPGDPPDPMWPVRLDVYAGTEQEAVFVNPTSPSNHTYVLSVTEPVYFRAPVGALDGGRVWINGTLAYEFECDELYSEWNCLEGLFRRIDLPPGLVEFGENHIRVAVDGWGEPFIFFAINRLMQD